MGRNERVVKIADDLGLSGTEFAKKIRTSRQMFSNWKGNYTPVSDKMIIRIIETFPDVDARWLVTGEQPKSQEEITEGEVFKKALKELREQMQESIRARELLLEERSQVIEMQKKVISVLEKQSAIAETESGKKKAG